ncbi:hypothetical protein DFJ68_0399 [Terracoccus luteus]|jgi:hypothetical protein|uniref:DUF6299 domain-containing protein n=2 Tax=Terracoccus luteus TaxID=53356 RepID=A0A495XSV6_9MICO|nr:hypothetical protein DFJ68_0399 [Terracoccus luteus]
MVSVQTVRGTLMGVRRLLVAVATAALLVPATAAVAAAAPANDTAGGARALAALPKTVTQNTTTATTDALDAELNAQCGAPATNGSVWFRVVDKTGAGLLVDTTASDYSAGIMIVAGDPSDGGQLVACGPGLSATRGEPGTTYWVMAFSDTPSVTGGTLKATFSEAPPAPTAALTVNRNAVATRDGSLRLKGTYSCTNADGYQSDIEGLVQQRAGRLKINGFFFVNPIVCDGKTRKWNALATSDNGYFDAGKATTASIIFACGALECAAEPVERTLVVTRGWS